MSNEAIFRSAEMTLAQLYVSYDSAKETVRALGELGCIHFRDLNAQVPKFQRAYVDQIKFIQNCLRQTRHIEGMLSAHSIEEAPYWDGQLLPSVDKFADALDQLDQRLTEMNDSEQDLLTKQTALNEQRSAWKHLKQHFGDSTGGLNNVVIGVIHKSKLSVFQRICWRSVRGNLVYTNFPISKFHNYAASECQGFMIVTYGNEFKSKITKIVEAMAGHIFELEDMSISDNLDKTLYQLEEVHNILTSTRQLLRTELEIASEDIAKWKAALLKDERSYEVLNKFIYDDNRKVLVSEGWIPTDDMPKVQYTLNSISSTYQLESPSLLTRIETTRTPPTFHRTNKVTEAFQNMVDVYAIASYREVNPALPTVVTFPFMFAVMFGDIGHGFIMFLAALLVVLNERKLASFKGGDVFDMFYSGRYVILLMGLFSIFTGFMYNDLFSKSLTLFPSGWTWPPHQDGEPIEAVSTNRVYAIGIDYMWHGAENNLRFLNSYKMKLSVIMGYVHMLYSFFFSLVNSLNNKSKLDIYGNFIPGLIFFLSIFGYLSIGIVYKWTVDWNAIGKQPPSLMNMLINMFLAPGKIDEPLYAGQKYVQLFLLFAALGSVPFLLLVKPLVLKKQIDSKYESLPQHQPVDGEEEHEEESFGDIMIEQAIHTIEFCLNSVSHTASYLRLWALSLAHSQLSQVLWDMTLALSFGGTGVLGVIMTVVMFAVWMTLTVAILVLMEGTSAMLHALRLHWVESMSKFYIGEGYAFEPFSFKELH